MNRAAVDVGTGGSPALLVDCQTSGGLPAPPADGRRFIRAQNSIPGARGWLRRHFKAQDGAAQSGDGPGVC